MLTIKLLAVESGVGMVVMIEGRPLFGFGEVGTLLVGLLYLDVGFHAQFYDLPFFAIPQ